MAILKIRDAAGNVQEILAIKGEKGDPGAVSYDTLTPEQKKELTAEGTALCAAVAAGVTTIEQNNNTPLQFWVGTQAEYDAIETKEDDVFYIISDDAAYQEIVKAIETLAGDVEKNTEAIKNNETATAQLQTHLNEPIVRVATSDDIEPKLKELYAAMPDYTVARFFIVGGEGASAVGNFFECYKLNNLYGHVEKIENFSRYTCAIGGENGGQWFPWDRFAFTYEIPTTSEV